MSFRKSAVYSRVQSLGDRQGKVADKTQVSGHTLRGKAAIMGYMHKAVWQNMSFEFLVVYKSAELMRENVTSTSVKCSAF